MPNNVSIGEEEENPLKEQRGSEFDGVFTNLSAKPEILYLPEENGVDEPPVTSPHASP